MNFSNSSIRRFIVQNKMLIRIGKFSSFVKRHFRSRVFISTLAYKEEKVKIGKWDINYLKVGNGPNNILCMPGTLGSIWTDFNPQIEGLDREKFTIVAWDPPGYGKSRPPIRDFPGNIDERDADYGYELMKVLKIPKYSLMGWSVGGRCSMILAAKYPEAVEKMVIWGTLSFITSHEMESCTKMKDLNIWSKKMKEPMIDMYGEKILADYWSQLVDWMTVVYKENDGEVCSHLLKDIICPTFILFGEKDPIISNMHVHFLHKHIKNSRIHLYPEGKHNLHIAYSQDFNKRIEEFLLCS